MFCLLIETDMTIFLILVIIGLFSGVYHGFFNNQIYHDSKPDNDWHKKIHTIWIHCICSIIGSFCLYLMYKKFFTTNNFVFNIEIGDVIVLLIGLLGVVGLLPMTLWFMVLSINKLQNVFLNLIKKW